MFILTNYLKPRLQHFVRNKFKEQGSAKEKRLFFTKKKKNNNRDIFKYCIIKCLDHNSHRNLETIQNENEIKSFVSSFYILSVRKQCGMMEYYLYNFRKISHCVLALGFYLQVENHSSKQKDAH
jgi:hypothetical protein